MDPETYFKVSNSISRLEKKYGFDFNDATSVVDEAIVKINRYPGQIRSPKAFFERVLRNEAYRLANWYRKHEALPLDGIDAFAATVDQEVDAWPDIVRSTLGIPVSDTNCELLRLLFEEGRSYRELAPKLELSVVAARARFSEIKRAALARKSKLKRAV